MKSRRYILVCFQEGIPAQVGTNGCTVEDVIDTAVERLHELNGRLPCRENEMAVARLEEAKDWLLLRTTRRTVQGVEGTERSHVDPFPVTIG
jgi:hypothetical protein